MLLYIITEWLDWMKLFVGLKLEAEDEEKVVRRRRSRSTKNKKKDHENGRRKTRLPHAAHVRSEVEDLVAPGDDLFAVVVHAEVDEVELVAELLLLLVCWFVCFFFWGGGGEGEGGLSKSSTEGKGEIRGQGEPKR